MAIAAANGVYSDFGPAESGQAIAFALSGNDIRNFVVGKATFTGDGSDTDATLNFIDGTKTLAFTPSRILAFRSGGDAAATISVLSATGVTNALALLTFSAAAASGKTIIVTFIALP